MKKTTLGILLGAALVIGGGAWYASRPAAEAGTAGAPAKDGKAGGKGGQGPTAVSVVSPRREDVPVVLQANGTVTPLSTVDLHPQTTSTITKVHIREGQFVKAGELMFTLDDRSARANVDKAQAQVARDQATLADLDRQYRRGQELLSKNFIAQGAVDTLKSQVDSARALLAADVAAARSAGVDASYNTIRAPMNGRVGAINVYAGSLVQLATSLTTITQLDPITVSFTLPESALNGLLAAQHAGAVPVKVAAGNGGNAGKDGGKDGKEAGKDGGKDITGALSFIDNTVDPVAGVIRVKAQFDNRDTQLWPGQYVNTRLTVKVLKGVTVIPQNAIISNTRGTFVYVVDQDQTAKVVNVQRLHSFGADAAVSGLEGGERIVLDGKQNLRPGGKLRVAEPGAKGGVPAGGADKQKGGPA
ncbi:efflux RND transporter periplasmic adaptor subunit [Oxalobacteraceae bacterium]|nr:efflux RND transporter periplasmic adaptor subunit [Oxalobacteraceae bacterium]